MIKFILQDKLVDEDKAYVHVSDLALLRGYGIFDFFRLVGNKPLFLDEHLERFYRSAKIMRLECPLEQADLKALIIKMLNHNQVQNSGVRMVMTGGPSPNGYFIGKPTLIVINEPISPLPDEHFTHGIKLISTSYKRILPEVKTINYIKGIHMLPEVYNQHAVDVLYHYHNKILETTRSNFFIVDKNGVLKTAGDNVLMGINRKHVLNIAKKHFDIEEGTVKMEELKDAREAFITGTTKKVTPVVQVDDKTIGNGTPCQTTKWLMHRYEVYLQDYVKSVPPCF